MKALIALLALALLALPGCKDREPQYTYFIVRVDSLKAPDSLQLGDSMYVRPYGHIGWAGNYSLDRMDTLQVGTALHLTAWGKRDNWVRYVNFPEVRIEDSLGVHPKTRGTLITFVHQPDGSVLTVSTVVF